MIKELTNEEASRLRDLVRCRFLQSPFNGAGFRVSQHKDSYRPLADDIVRVVPGTEASVTTNRLRKLFYYTNPEICEESKKQKPSFGDDFIQAIFKYIEEEQPIPPPPPPPIPRKWRWLGAALLLLLAVAVATWQWLDRPEYWEEDFNDVSVEGLKSRDWEILDYDPTAFSKQLKPGCLTLYTYPGGYWVKKDSGEIPVIKNMIIKKIRFNECLLTSRMMSFDPYQNYQGIGMFVMGPDRSREDYLSVFFVYATHPVKEDSVIHIQKIQVVLMVNGKPEEKSWNVRIMNNERSPIPEVEFEIKIEQKKAAIGFRTIANWRPVDIDRFEINLPFYPKYVGLGATQGFTDFSGRPLNADTIPAFFDYLKVEPLPE